MATTRHECVQSTQDAVWAKEELLKSDIEKEQLAR